MKYLILALVAVVGLTGCATRSGNAALAGAAIGAIIANEANRPLPPRVLHCHTYIVAYDQYRRPIYQQVCQ